MTDRITFRVERNGRAAYLSPNAMELLGRLAAELLGCRYDGVAVVLQRPEEHGWAFERASEDAQEQCSEPREGRSVA